MRHLLRHHLVGECLNDRIQTRSSSINSLKMQPKVKRIKNSIQTRRKKQTNQLRELRGVEPRGQRSSTECLNTPCTRKDTIGKENNQQQRNASTGIFFFFFFLCNLSIEISSSSTWTASRSCHGIALVFPKPENFSVTSPTNKSLSLQLLKRKW